MEKMLDIMSHMSQTCKVLKVSTFCQEENEGKITLDNAWQLESNANESGRAYKHIFTIVATEWTRQKTLQVMMRKVILPYLKPADPAWLSDTVFSDETFTLTYD